MSIIGYTTPVEVERLRSGKTAVIQGERSDACTVAVRLGEADEGAGPVGEAVAWRDMASAPKDGTLVKLLVRPYTSDEEGAWTPFEDSADPQPTIGFNSLANTEEDRWQFAGWCWSHDHIIEGDGEVIGWVPFARPVEEPGEVERDNETYEIGKRDGYEEAVQHIDERTGGDGEYVAVVGYDPEGRNCPDAPSMIAKIVARFEAAVEEISRQTVSRGEEGLRAETAEAALAETRDRLEKVGALLRVVESETPDDSYERQGGGTSTFLTWETVDALRAALTGDAQEAGR